MCENIIFFRSFFLLSLVLILKNVLASFAPNLPPDGHRSLRSSFLLVYVRMQSVPVCEPALHSDPQDDEQGAWRGRPGHAC